MIPFFAIEVSHGRVARLALVHATLAAQVVQNQHTYIFLIKSEAIIVFRMSMKILSNQAKIPIDPRGIVKTKLEFSTV